MELMTKNSIKFKLAIFNHCLLQEKEQKERKVTPQCKITKKIKLKYSIENKPLKKTKSHQFLNIQCFKIQKSKKKSNNKIKEKINNFEVYLKKKKTNDKFRFYEKDEKENFLRYNYKKKPTIIEDLTLMNISKFKYQEEKKDINYILKSKGNKSILNFIDIDLFFQYIALDKPFFENEEDNTLLIEGFCLQYIIFIPSDTLINKIIFCYNYFYPEKAKDKNKFPIGLIKFLIKFIHLHSKYKIEELSKNVLKNLNDFLKEIKKLKLKDEYEEIIQLFEIELKEYESSIKIFNPIVIKESEKIKEENIISSGESEEENDEKENKDDALEQFLADVEIVKKEYLEEEYYFNILKFKSKDIAAELTEIKYNLFNKIEVKEFLKGAFNSQNKLSKSPNICQIIQRFNNLSYWVTEEILSYDESQSRANIISKFIHICSGLKKLGNFDDLFSILSSITSFLVNKLNKSWKKLSNKDMEQYKSLAKILTFEDNWKNLRNEIENRQKEKLFYIPYLGYYTKRILFLEEMGSYIKKGTSLINVEKIIEVYKALKDFYQFKNVKYWGYTCKSKYIKDELLILQCLEPSDEASLDELSDLLEPKFILSNKKSKMKRQSNTDKNYFYNLNKFKLIK